MSATQEILEIIQRTSEPLSIQYIADRTGFASSTVRKEIDFLLKTDKIHRIKGKGHSWRYLSGSTPIKNKDDAVDKLSRPSKISGVSTKELEKFLKVMTKKKWVHPLFESQLSLNRIVLRLYALAYEKATGSDVDDSDLETERKSLEILLEKSQQYTDFITSILKQGYLWDSDTFAIWLTENCTAEEIRTMVRLAKEYN